jgi:hypothetical protein
VEKALFSVSCTTCRAKISVRKKEAIGQILECPKCKSFVLIAPPDGWVDEEPQTKPSTAPPSPKKTVAASPVDDSVKAANKGPVPIANRAQKAAVAAPPVQAAACAVTASATATEIARASAAAAAQPVAVAGASPPAPAAAPPPTEGPQAVAVRLGFTPYTVPGVVAGETYLSALSQSFAGRMAVLALSALLGLAGVLGVWLFVLHRHHSATASTDKPADTAPAEDAVVQSKSAPELIDRRWLPEQTVCVLDLRPSRLAQESQSESVDFLLRRWQPYADVQAMRIALNMRQEHIRRLTWALTDLNDASASCVVFELEDGANLAAFVPKDEDVDLGNKLTARRLKAAPWPHTVVLVDGRRIVAGNEEVIRRLAAYAPADRGDVPIQSWPLDLLLKKLVPAGEVAVLFDVATARAALRSPADWLDVWPEGRSSWRLLCETPLAMGLSVKTVEDHRCEVGLVCSGETSAKTLGLELEKLLAAAMRALPGHVASLQKTVPPGKVGAGMAREYRRLLDDLHSSLHTYGCQTADGILWLRLSWFGQSLPNWLGTALESEAAWKTDRLAAALLADESNHRGLLDALHKYAKAQSPERFPAGAANFARSLGPETRLSWLAELLPFLGRNDWNLDFASNWNSTENQRFTRRPLPGVVNPALGPAAAPGDYPVTHYVGAAGVGEDAAGLPADDPRAGVFGYERQTRPQDLVRGGANTIDVLGVQDRCGPWAQGGRATVRPLTQRPYVNGPDGFGSGQAEGMVVGMADGSARFLSDKIDPEIMEKLVTVRGGDKVDMSALDPQPDILEQPLAAPPPAPLKPSVKPPVANPKPSPPLDPRLQARLSEPVLKLSLSKMPLGDAVRLVASVGALKVTFDPDAMEEIGVSLGDPVSIEAADVTVGALLDQIAAARNMARVVENGQVVLSSKSAFREELQTVRYTVSDLTRGNQQAAAELAVLIQRFVALESWQAHGGGGTIEVSPDALKIAQTGSVHHQIVVFCEKLRVARGLPPRSHLDPKQFSLQTRVFRARPILGRTTSINVVSGTPLAEILEQFKQPPGTEVLIDRPALAAAGVNENTTAKLRSENLPQGVVLRQLLQPLGLAWRAVDANTLQITSQKAVAARLEIEFYPLAKRLAAQPPAAVIDQLRTGVPGAVWGDAGASGALYFDPPSQCLIVLQTQPAQAAIEAILAQGAK